MSIAKKWSDIRSKLSESSCDTAKQAAKAAAIGLSALTTVACATAPPHMDQPNNGDQRVTDSFVKGAILGAGVRRGNTKENIVAAVLVGGISAIVTDGRNKRAQEAYSQLREAGIQAIELPKRRGTGDRVMLQTAPSTRLALPIKDNAQTAEFLNSVNALSYAISLYRPSSYTDVQVVLTMPEGCSAEAREVADKLQHYAHTQLNLPIAVVPNINEAGKLSYEEAVNLRPAGSFSRARSRGRGEQGCDASSTATISTVMSNITR